MLRLLITLLIATAVVNSQQPPTTATYQGGGGMSGYFTLPVDAVPAGYGAGLSLYSTAWKVLESPINNFQAGIGTWLIPDNNDFTKALCPAGTQAGDNWPERGPYYRDVFQTIEGGLGWWVNLQNRTTAPKFQINTTSNCYSFLMSSVGYTSGVSKPISCDETGLVILSNRLLYPTDFLTLRPETDGQIVGYAWMALPWIRARQNGSAPTGDASWTLFLNTANFKGPVAFVTPSFYSDLSRGYPVIQGRGLDTRPVLTGALALEVGSVPHFYAAAPDGTTYHRLPRIHFPPVTNGRSVLATDATRYSTNALYEPLKNWMSGAAPMPTGAFAAGGSYSLKCSNASTNLLSSAEANAPIRLSSVLQFESGFSGCSYGIKWLPGTGFPAAELPQYYRKQKNASNQFELVPVKPEEVPASLKLTEQTFPGGPGPGGTFTVAASQRTCWSTPGPSSGPYYVTLADGSELTYFWYKFVDQPALQRLNLAEDEKASLQRSVEAVHGSWPIDGRYMADPATATPLAAIDDALIVTPPAGLEAGYVPVVTTQRRPVPLPPGYIKGPSVASPNSIVTITTNIVSLPGANARLDATPLQILSVASREMRVLIPGTAETGIHDLTVFNGDSELTLKLKIVPVAGVFYISGTSVEVTDPSGVTQVTGCSPVLLNCSSVDVPVLAADSSLRLRLRGTGFRFADPAAARVRIGWTEYPVDAINALDANGNDEALVTITVLPPTSGAVDVAFLPSSGSQPVEPSGFVTLNLPGDILKGVALNPVRAFTAGASGAWYFTDPPTRSVQKVTAAGAISTIYQAASAPGNGIAIDSQERIYIVVSGQLLRISSDGTMVETLYSGPGFTPWGIALDEPRGFLYGGNGTRVSRINLADGTLQTIAGTGERDTSGDDGPAEQAKITNAFGLAVTPDGNRIVFSDAVELRQIDLVSGIITALAGSAGAGVSPDGTPASQSKLTIPHGVAFDTYGAVVFTQLGQPAVRRINADGTISTIAGNLGDPVSIAMDRLGYLFILDIVKQQVNRLTPSLNGNSIVASTK